MSLFRFLQRDTSPPAPPPPPLGDPCGGVVYLRNFVFSRGSISLLWVLHNSCFYGEALLAPRPTPKLEDHPLVGCPRLLIQFILSYPPYRRTFLHPQPEDAPCRGVRDPLTWPAALRPVFPSVEQLIRTTKRCSWLRQQCYFWPHPSHIYFCNDNVWAEQTY
jgi:hypothetical protein